MKKDFPAPDHFGDLKEVTLVHSISNRFSYTLFLLLSRRRAGADRASGRSQSRAPISQKNVHGEKGYEDALSPFRAAQLRFL